MSDKPRLTAEYVAKLIARVGKGAQDQRDELSRRHDVTVDRRRTRAWTPARSPAVRCYSPSLVVVLLVIVRHRLRIEVVVERTIAPATL